MSAAQVNAALVAIGSVGLALGVRLVASPLVRVVVPPRIGTTSTATSLPPRAQADSLVAALVGKDPFRVTRRPATVLYDAVSPETDPSRRAPRRGNPLAPGVGGLSRSMSFRYAVAQRRAPGAK